MPARRLLPILAALLLAVLGLATGAERERTAPTSGPTDLGLYAYAATAAAHPLTFYPALIAEQRREGYELKPFVVVRPPALPFLLAALKSEALRRLALGALALGSLAAWWMTLGRQGVEPLPRAFDIVALATGALPAVAPQAPYMHEVWAGLLISLSLALRREDRFGLAVAVGLAAALIRELAAPYLVVMAATALLGRHWREAAAWTFALAVFAAALAWHASMVDALVLPSDHAGAGWLKLSGWPFVLHAAQWNAVLAVAPAWLAALAVPAALAGAATWTSSPGRRLAATLVVYVLAFAAVGRPENFYWGLMFAPLLPLGFARACRGFGVLQARTADRAVAQPS
ncbi:MAG: hypothetical protein ACXU82_18740 [Caulobacteraceae bacterium]